MIIFQRMVTFEGPPQDVVPWALEVTETVNARTGVNASLWQGMFGGPLGTLVWSAMIENLTALEAVNDTLAGDAGYLDLVSRAQGWTSAPPEDSLLRVVHVAGGEYVRPDVGAYAEATIAVPAEGKLARAGAFGVEIADVHAELTHSSVLFCTSAYGTFGELRWIGVYESAAEVDRAAEVITKDDGYAKRLDEAGGLFVEGLAQRALARRIA